MSFYQFIQYLKYRLKAKNRHGIHSPFVYALTDQCLLAGSGDLLTKRLPEYFGSEHIQWFSKEPEEWLEKLDPLNGVDVYIVPDIHKTEQHTNAWGQIMNDKRVMLSIDLFKTGLIINRKDFKEKQHFVLQAK